MRICIVRPQPHVCPAVQGACPRVCMYACSVRMCDMCDITSCAHAADSNPECDDEDAEADTLKRRTRTLKRTRRRCRRTSRGRGGRSRSTGGERSGGRRAKQQTRAAAAAPLEVGSRGETTKDKDRRRSALLLLKGRGRRRAATAHTAPRYVHVQHAASRHQRTPATCRSSPSTMASADVSDPELKTTFERLQSGELSWYAPAP